MNTTTADLRPALAEKVAPVAAVKVKAKRAFGPFFWVCSVWLGVILLFALLGKLLPFAKKESDYLVGGYIQGTEPGKGWLDTFSGKHLLGTDENGRDILATVVLGARNSIIIAFATVFLGFLIGGFLGMISGYARGKLDTVLSFLMTSLQSFPPLLFILLFLSLTTANSDGGTATGLSANVFKLSFSLAVLSTPSLFRIVRASTMLFANREFVVAARSMGAKRWRILMREILPNVAKPMLAYGLVSAGTVMVVEGSLSFLGVGVGDKPAWGNLIQSGAGFSGIKRSPHVAFVPMFFLFMTVLAFNYIGDQIRAKLEVKQAGI